MPTTSKSHKSRKTETPGRPRQRKASATNEGIVALTSPAESPSSLVPATTAPSLPNKLAVLDATRLAPEKAEQKSTGVPAELPKEQQPWYRAPDSKLRKQAEQIAVMRLAGHKGSAIAKKLKTSEGNVRFVEYIARKNGWYDDDGEPIDIEAELAHTVDRKIVRNISASLDGQMTNWQTHEMTIAAAKGRGHFRNHEKTDGQPTQLPIVAIQVVMPPIGAADQHVLNENDIGGVPAYIDGEVAKPALVEGDSDGRRLNELGADTPHPEAVSS